MGDRHPVTGSIVILQIAHWDHRLDCNGYFDLYALCQRCHNLHDLENRLRTKWKKRHRANPRQLEFDWSVIRVWGEIPL